MSLRYIPCHKQRLFLHIALSIAFGICVFLNGGCRRWEPSFIEGEALVEIAKLTDIEKIYKYAAVSAFPRVRKRATERLCGMRSKNQQDYLRTLAKVSADAEVRRIAVAAIANQDYLKYLAGESADAEVRRIAVASITNQDYLKDLAEKSPDAAVRRIAVASTTNQDYLKSLAAESRDGEVRRIAVTSITNQDHLKSLAESSDSEVRHIAVTGITHQGHLEALAWGSKYTEVRCIAVTGVTNQGWLEKLTKESPHGEVRRIAVTSITNETLRIKTAFEDKDLSVRDSAASKITDHDTLVNLFLEGNVSDDIIMRLPQDERLNGEKAQKRWASVVTNSSNAIIVRGMALMKLTDRSLLATPGVQFSMADLLCHSFDTGNTEIPQKAKDRLFNPDALVHLAVATQDRGIRNYCIGRINNNDDSLYEIVRKVRNDERITQSAIVKMTDQGVLGNVAQNKNLTEAERVTAIKKLDKASILRTLENDSDPKIREAATARLRQFFQE